LFFRTTPRLSGAIPPLLGGGRPTGTDASAGAGASSDASGAAAPGADGAWPGPVRGGSDAEGTDEVG